MKAHQGEYLRGHEPSFHDAKEPDIAGGRTTGSLRRCSWCGSMAPEDVAAALRAGATISPADRKYGWPHKFYLDGVPNPHAGMLESRMSSSDVIPICPTTGERCKDGRQSFQFARCQCMKERTPIAGVDEQGRKFITIPDGYSAATGQPVKRWTIEGEPASPTTWGKFYSVHLKDATPEDKLTIERAIGMHINFGVDKEGDVQWKSFQEPA